MNILNTFFKSVTYSMLLLTLLPVAVQAQDYGYGGSAEDYGSDFHRNESLVQAPNRNSKLAAGSLWQVVASSLNCRHAASLDSSIIRKYRVGVLIEAEVYRGGSDEVLVNPVDRDGKPWMPVRGKNAENVCYVRANSLYISPISPK